MAWQKNAPGSIQLGYDWYRGVLTNQHVSMRPRFCGFDMGLSDLAQVGAEAAAVWAARQAFKAGLKALAVQLVRVLGGPVAASVLGLEVYSWTTWDTSFTLRSGGLGLPPVQPVPMPY